MRDGSVVISFGSNFTRGRRCVDALARRGGGDEQAGARRRRRRRLAQVELRPRVGLRTEQVLEVATERARQRVQLALARDELEVLLHLERGAERSRIAGERAHHDAFECLRIVGAQLRGRHGIVAQDLREHDD